MQNRFRTLGIAVTAIVFALLGLRALRAHRTDASGVTASGMTASGVPGVNGTVAEKLAAGGASSAMRANRPVEFDVAEGNGASREARPASAPAPFPERSTPDSHAFGVVNTSANAVDPAGAMLLRQGQASLEVRHVDEEVARVRQAAAQFGGFVANASVRGGRDETRAASLELRVPSGQFDALVAALGGLGRVESVTASAQDAGDEYVDLAARAANARRFEARLTEMLATRTGKLSDVLSMEQELARVREQVERYEGRIKFLERRASLSTLTIALHEPLPLIERPNPGPLTDAFVRAWERALGVLAWCIAALGLLIPGALLLGAMALLVRRATRKPAMTPPTTEVRA